MANILVSGLINIETTLRVDGFPVQYSPVLYPFHGVHSTVSGVGYNVAKACTALGHDVSFLSLIGQDAAANLVERQLRLDRIPSKYVVRSVPETAQSVILYDADGKRQIHVDLKDLQERAYPIDFFHEAAQRADLFALCNINFSRPFLELARRSGKPVATDVHAISRLDDEYNRDFLRAAHILFLSDELLPVSPEDWVEEILWMYPAEIVVIGLGSEGALLRVRKDGVRQRIPAARMKKVVSTIGAGDALFSAFLHGYLRHRDPYRAIRMAVAFAGHKIGSASASEGFLSADQLEQSASE